MVREEDQDEGAGGAIRVVAREDLVGAVARHRHREAPARLATEEVGRCGPKDNRELTQPQHHRHGKPLHSR
jgi:hypothetical protein